MATSYIRQDYVDAAIVVGADEVTGLQYEALSRLGLLASDSKRAQERSCPFDDNRNGMILERLPGRWYSRRYHRLVAEQPRSMQNEQVWELVLWIVPRSQITYGCRVAERDPARAGGREPDTRICAIHSGGGEFNEGIGRVRGPRTKVVNF